MAEVQLGCRRIGAAITTGGGEITAQLVVAAGERRQPDERSRHRQAHALVRGRRRASFRARPGTARAGCGQRRREVPSLRRHRWRRRSATPACFLLRRSAVRPPAGPAGTAPAAFREAKAGGGGSGVLPSGAAAIVPRLNLIGSTSAVRRAFLRRRRSSPASGGSSVPVECAAPGRFRQGSAAALSCSPCRIPPAGWIVRQGVRGAAPVRADPRAASGRCGGA